MTDFKESPLMYALAAIIILFIIVQAVFFIVKSWKHGKSIGISTETLKNTVISSALFTLAPAISILVTVIALAGALGIVLPWIRLTVIGNLAYETVAAENTLAVMGGSLSHEVTDPVQFTTVAWAMNIGAVFPLPILPFLCKKIQKKVGSVVNKSEKTSQLGDVIAAAAFIGIISAFITRAINGCTTVSVPGTDGKVMSIVSESAGLISILTLVFAIVFMLLLMLICKKAKNGAKLEPFAMPVAMFAAMGMAILMTRILPENLASFTWYEIGGMLR